MSKFFTAAAIILALTSPALAISGKKLNTIDEFQSRVVGKILTSSDGFVTVRKNGSIGGEVQGKKLKGKWNWQEGYFCRSLVWGGKNMGSACQEIRVNGKSVHFIRDQGKGSATSYTIK